MHYSLFNVLQGNVKVNQIIYAVLRINCQLRISLNNSFVKLLIKFVLSALTKSHNNRTTAVHNFDSISKKWQICVAITTGYFLFCKCGQLNLPLVNNMLGISRLRILYINTNITSVFVVKLTDQQQCSFLL
ncbi:hypothetical protein T08_8044 [Trichinella sp. T8]|nr:hypothetical protein T08_8044 [Trichinella sp. T8]